MIRPETIPDPPALSDADLAEGIESVWLAAAGSPTPNQKGHAVLNWLRSLGYHLPTADKP